MLRASMIVAGVAVALPVATAQERETWRGLVVEEPEQFGGGCAERDWVPRPEAGTGCTSPASSPVDGRRRSSTW